MYLQPQTVSCNTHIVCGGAEAMRELGDEMSGSSVATILDAMDVHGFISVDQFVAIVEAEAIESHSSDAKMLRRLSKDPVWWTRST